MLVRPGRRGAIARRWCNLIAGGVASACCGAAMPAGAITITTSYRSPLSNAPSSDPNGSKLAALFAHAADYYEDIFEDPGHTLEVQFYYFDFFNTATVGNTTLATQSNGRATKVYITLGKRPLGSQSGWYFDSDPSTHDEFNLQQTLAGDLADSQQSAYFNGNVPDTLEAGYQGYGGGGAAGKLDAYSLVLHEIGHALGMLSTNTATQNETSDGDYDFDPALVGGYNVAAENISGGISHLEAPDTLMFTNFNPGQRKLPSAADLLAMAAGHDYHQLDLQRIDFLADGGGNAWSSGKWVGGRNPDPSDDAFIRSADFNPTVALQSDQAVRNLTVARGDNLDLNNRRLTVGNTLTLRDHATDLDVRGGGNAVLTVGTLDAGDNTKTTVRDGGRIDAGTVELRPGSTLRLDGNATVAGNLRLHGTIETAANAGTKTLDGITQTSASTRVAFDLHGSAPGQHGTLTINFATPPNAPAGTLTLNTNYATQPGDTLRLIDHAGSASPRLFENVEGIQITPNLRWAVRYAADHLDVLAALAGDADFDGDVDFADAMTLRRSFAVVGEPPEGFAWTDGDYDSDGDVDFDDAVTLAVGYTGSNPPPAAEPGTGDASNSGHFPGRFPGDASADVADHTASAGFDAPLTLVADTHTGTLSLAGDTRNLVAVSITSQSGTLAEALADSHALPLVLRSSPTEWSALRLTQNQNQDPAGHGFALPLDWTPSAAGDLTLRYARQGQWQTALGRIDYVPEPSTAVLLLTLGGWGCRERNSRRR